MEIPLVSEAAIDILSAQRRSHEPKMDSLGASECPLGCIVEVAADSHAMIEALAEFGFRLVMEDAADWENIYDRTWFNAKKKVITKLADEIKSKQGQK